MPPQESLDTSSVSESLALQDTTVEDVLPEPTLDELAETFRVEDGHIDASDDDEKDAVEAIATTSEAEVFVDIPKAQDKLRALYYSGRGDTAEYLVLASKLSKVENGQTVWKTNEEINLPDLADSLEYFERQEVAMQGRVLLSRLYASGKGNSTEYISLYEQLVDQGQWKEPSAVNIELISGILASESAVQSESVPDDGNREAEPSYESKMLAREVEEARPLNSKEASKQFLSAERMKLAEELRAARRAQRERLGTLQTDIEATNRTGEDIEADTEYGSLANRQGEEATETAERIKTEDLTEAEAVEERATLAELIDTSVSMEALKQKLAEHYAAADTEAQQQFESVRKTVEQTLIRNKVFIVHSFLLNEELRHNENSNIDQRATIEDDMDALLSLEPSISTSSVMPGTRQGLWSEGVGVILGGGDIRGVAGSDDGTLTGGIKFRNGQVSSPEEIDNAVSNSKDRGYNELVVNNPKVFGFYSTVKTDEAGNMVGFKSEKDSANNKLEREKFVKYIDLAHEKGMPPLIMTPDRRLFEFKSIGEDGIVTVGNEITPEDVARGAAGLGAENRKSLGERVIEKNLFRSIDDQLEAKQIVASLGGAEASQVELSREEYLAYARDTQGRIYEFPEQLRSDRDFMLEVAQVNPVSAYERASESLKRDRDYIQEIYKLRSLKEGPNFVYQYLPQELKKDESLALLAIENNDFGSLDASLADIPSVWGALTDKLVAKSNPDILFANYPESKEQVNHTFLQMYDGDRTVNMTKEMRTPEFIAKLNASYPKYRFEPFGSEDFLITKLSE